MDSPNQDRLYRIILHQCERKLKNLASESLLMLEARDQYIKEMENTFTKMGIGEYDKSGIDFAKDRKRILDCCGNYVRELQQIDKLL